MAIVCALVLVTTLIETPLFPVRWNSKKWLQGWLRMTLLDYYGAAFPFCALIYLRETAVVATVWSLCILLLGSPFACVYIATRFGPSRF